MLPDANLLLDFQPLRFIDLSYRRRLDNDLLIELVNLGIDDAMAHGFDDPLLNVVFFNIEQLCNLLESLLALLPDVLLDATNLNVLLLQNSLLLGNLLLLQQLVLFRNLCLELLNVFLQEQINECQQLFALLTELLNGIDLEDLLEVECVWTPDSINNQSLNMLLLALIHFFLVLVGSGVNKLGCIHVHLEGS